MSDILDVGRKLAESYHSQEGGGFENTGCRNIYECDGEGGTFTPHKEGCGYFIVTIDRHPGVTPFGIKCGNCGMLAHSKMYRVSEYLSPSHEWYRPETLEGVDEAYHEHLSKGGLILRPIGDLPDIWDRPVTEGEIMAKRMRELRELEKIESRLPSRQMRRQIERKGDRNAPAEIQMYGHTYRRVD